MRKLRLERKTHTRKQENADNDGRLLKFFHQNIIHRRNISYKYIDLNHQNDMMPLDQELMLSKADYIDKIIHGDCLEIMKRMPDESVDIILTSPPYNLKNSTGNGMKDGRCGKWANAALQNGYESHSDDLPHEEYVAWQKDCLREMMRLIPDNGAIFYNHKWRVQGGLLQDRSDIVSQFPVRQIIIWKRSGGINFNSGYFLPTYEVIYLIAKKNFKLAPKANAYGDVWDIKQEFHNKHPAPFPLELAKRVISSTTAEIVLDPFMGSGTTALAAKTLDRHYVGIELSKEYCKMAEDRLTQSVDFYALSSHCGNENSGCEYNDTILKR